LEGGLIYTVSALLRDEIEAQGHATIHLDLKPDWSQDRLVERLSKPRGSRSWSSHLRRTVGLEGVKAGLLREYLSKDEFVDPQKLAGAIKSLPIPLKAPRPLAEAISSAGGVRFEELDQHLMLHRLPGVFLAGEMLDWEAPTGGYLLTACFAMGKAAGEGAARWLQTSLIDF
jgi:predicted flavoprotein YhiN